MMGYRTNIFGQIDLKKGVNHLVIKQEFEDECKKRNGYYDFFSWLEYTPTRIIVDAPDTSASGEEMTPLFEFLAKHASKDTYLQAQGDDTEDLWEVWFDGDGGFDVKYATVIYGYEPFKQFMHELGDKLQPNLKKQLEEWYGATKL
jgi:hypothetical protein